MNPYIKFGLMILTSTIVMYGLMYFNTYELGHVTFSETRVYMAIMMGGFCTFPAQNGICASNPSGM